MLRGRYCGLLRPDLRSDYERPDRIREILSLIVPPAFELFHCRMLGAKIPPFAAERKTAEQTGFVESKETLASGEDGKIYTDYYVLLK